MLGIQLVYQARLVLMELTVWWVRKLLGRTRPRSVSSCLPKGVRVLRVIHSSPLRLVNSIRLRGYAHSAVSGHFGCFQFGAITNNASTDIHTFMHMHTFLWVNT